MKLTKLQEIKQKKEEETLDINSIVEEYNSISTRIKVFDTRKKELANLIKSYATKHGVKRNDTGSMMCENDQFIFGKQAKNSVRFDEEKAKPYLEEHGLLEDVTEIKKVIDVSKVEDLIERGVIPTNDASTLFKVSTSYSVSVKKKETVNLNDDNMPEVKVASTKKRIIKKK